MHLCKAISRINGNRGWQRSGGPCDFQYYIICEEDQVWPLKPKYRDDLGGSVERGGHFCQQNASCSKHPCTMCNQWIEIKQRERISEKGIAEIDYVSQKSEEDDVRNRVQSIFVVNILK